MFPELNFSAVLNPASLGMLADGLQMTLLLVVLTIPLSLVFALILTMLRSSRFGLLRVCGHAAAEMLRNVPGVFWLLLWYLVVPVVAPAQWGGRMNEWQHWALFSAVMGLSLNNSPYLADILRAGLSSVPREACQCARLSGLPSWPLWRRVILPTAVLSALPALNARLVHGLKNTSLAMIISVQDLAWYAQEIEAVTFRGIEITCIVTAIYALLALSLSACMHQVERRMRVRMRLPLPFPEATR